MRCDGTSEGKTAKDIDKDWRAGEERTYAMTDVQPDFVWV